MRHGWASCSWLFSEVRASSLLSSMVFCHFSAFSLTASPTKKLRTNETERYKKRPTNAVIRSWGYGKRIGQNRCSENGFDLCCLLVPSARSGGEGGAFGVGFGLQRQVNAFLIDSKWIHVTR